MAPQRSKRSRKRRNPAGAPRAVASSRRELRVQRRTTAERRDHRANRQLGREGERPPSPFAGLPISELAILLGLIALVVAFIRGGGAALVVGIAVCALGVLEITAREHFSGYRSHTALLAAIPALAAGTGLVLLLGGEPRQRGFLLVVAVPVFGILFWVLRRRFQTARQARVARVPPPPRA